MKFITIAKLNNDLINNLHKLPRDIDIVVGIPRSGMLVAAMICLQLNLPLTDFDSFMEKKSFSSGISKNKENWVKDFKHMRKILIVEDSVNSGYSIEQVKKRLSSFSFDIDVEIVYFAAYVTPNGKKLVDIYLEIVPFPRLFEWNYMHHILLKNACLDIDGVLCEDPTEKENDDGANYLHFLQNVKPRFLPTAKIGWLVSSRLEKYRAETISWLKKHNVEWNELILMDVPSAEERQRMDNHAEFKAKVYKNLRNATWFVESSAKQAPEIARLSGKPVFCIENQQYYQGNRVIELRVQTIHTTKSFIEKIIKKILPPNIRKKLKTYLFKKD